jgi:hypothetical protein
MLYTLLSIPSYGVVAEPSESNSPQYRKRLIDSVHYDQVASNVALPFLFVLIRFIS